LDFVPQGGVAQRCFYFIIECATIAVELRAKGDVAINAHRKWIRLLEDNADVAPNRARVPIFLLKVFTPELTVPFETEAANKVVHAVDAAQNSALAASGGTDKGSNGVFLNSHSGIADRLEVAVVERLQVNVDNRIIVAFRAVGAEWGVNRFDVLQAHDGISYFIVLKYRRRITWLPRFKINTMTTRTNEQAQAISIWFL